MLLARKIVREPLVHFLLIGAGLFILFGWKGNPASPPGGQTGAPSSRIVVTKGDVDRLVAMFEKTWQRPPSKDEMKGLVESFIREEIYYREALAIGLDREDTVIRRRLRQKMEFIFEDVTAQVEPTDADLAAYMKSRPGAYRFDPQVAFLQVYVGVDKRGEGAEADARRMLAELERGAEPEAVGDLFLLEPAVSLSPVWDIRKQFGEAFAANLLDLEIGRWAGPVRSAYGLHLVYITKRLEGRMPELDEVREGVKRDWMAEQQKKLKDAAYTKIRERYTVVFEKPEGKAAYGIAEAGIRNLNETGNKSK